MVNHLYAALVRTTVAAESCVDAAQGRLRTLTDRRRRDDAGLATLEWVVLALGLFLLAGIAVGVITKVVNSDLGQIATPKAT